MATKQEQGTEASLQGLHLQQRRALNDAYAQLESDKNTQTFNVFSFEEALRNQIERIEGESTSMRPNELDRVDRVYFNLVKAVEELKQVPPEQFLTPNEETDVSTPQETSAQVSEQVVEDAVSRAKAAVAVMRDSRDQNRSVGSVDSVAYRLLRRFGP